MRLPSTLDAVGPETHYSKVERMLRGEGWTPCGTGDWAFALASPDGTMAAGISPFDPVGRFTAHRSAEAAATGAVPRLDLHRRLAGGADLLVMEFLEPIGEEEAKAFFGRVRDGAASSQSSPRSCTGSMRRRSRSCPGAVRWMRTRRT